MIIAEILGPKPYADRVKLYATDTDEEALVVVKPFAAGSP